MVTLDDKRRFRAVPGTDEQRESLARYVLEGKRRATRIVQAKGLRIGERTENERQTRGRFTQPNVRTGWGSGLYGRHRCTFACKYEHGRRPDARLQDSSVPSAGRE
jgi:hypothetical protein